MAYPILLYDALQDRGATITATSTASGFSTDNLLDRLWDQRWRSTGPASVERITFDLGAGNTSVVTAVAISGHNFDESMQDGGGTSQIDLEHSDDGATWSGGVTPADINPTTYTAATLIGRISGALTTTARRYVRINFRNASAPLDIGAIAIGRSLDFPEGMAQGFDTENLTLKSRQFRARGGNYAGGIADHVMKKVTLKFGPAGLSKSAFFDPTTLPSWRHFMRTCWSKARPFWLAFDLDNTPEDVWYGFPPENAKSSAPIITNTRRGWKMDIEVVAEGYMADAA